MKTKLVKEDIVLNDDEYIITPDCPDSVNYEVFLNGVRLNDVRYIVRLGGRA